MRAVSWIKAAYKSYERFPAGARREIDRALNIAALGEKADIAKPMTGLGAGVVEIAVKFRGDAWRAVYALQIGEDIWVVHAFQKKSTSGISTPKHEIDLVRDRIRTLKERYR
jgi:phage-related protein